MKNRLALVLVGVLAVASTAGFLAYYEAGNNAAQGGFRLEFMKTGGIAGVNDTMVVNDDGEATLASKYGLSFSAKADAVELAELKSVVATSLGGISPRTVDAKPGAADYFGYRLVVTDNSGTTEVRWVDQWAANGTFPEGLKSIQAEVEKLSADLTARANFVALNSTVTGGLRMTILTDKAGYKAGEQASYAVILENAGTTSVSYTSPTPCAPDIRVTVSNVTASRDVSGSDGTVCAQVLQGRTLQANTYILQTGSWSSTPGAYTVTAVFPYASFEKPLVDVTGAISVVS